MFAHAIENDTCMECSPFNGCEQFVLRRVLQVPAESHSAEIRIDQHRAIAIVPRHSQETGLTRMPVVDRENPLKLLGMVALTDLLRARTRDLGHIHALKLKPRENWYNRSNQSVR